MRAQGVSTAVAAAALVGFLAACSPAPSPPPAGDAAPPAGRSAAAATGTAPTSGSAICSASSSYTVLQVGKTDTGDRKKVANNCWWQFRVPDLHGYVDEPLRWELCNACDVDIEFQLRNVPANAMTGCRSFFDASGATTETVRSGSTFWSNCRGLSAVRDSYDVGARVAGVSTPFVADDPELEIEDRGFAPYVMRLAETVGLNYCLVPGFGPGRRVSVTGQFARLNATGAIVLVPTGPGLFSTTWGVDLVEIAERTGAALPEQQRSASFTLSADVPAFVTNFIVRDSNGPKDALLVGQLAPCK